MAIMKTETSTYRYLFGPVPSRRLGLSLGVDLVPMKTCSLNCVFCEVGRTTRHTLERREYVPLRDVLAELELWESRGGRAEYITLAGSGEPTLHTGFGRVLEFVRSRPRFASALLTNGTLFTESDVRRDACAADVVKLSLSAWDQASFERLHRPCKGVTLTDMVAGYRAFRRDYKGTLWVEVFLVPGFNDRTEDVRRIAALVASVAPDRIHLNTAVRPTAEQGVGLVEADRLEQLADLFRPRADVIASFSSRQADGGATDDTAILDMLRRRPCTAAQVAAAFGLEVGRVQRMLENSLRRGDVEAVDQGGEKYFVGRRASSAAAGTDNE